MSIPEEDFKKNMLHLYEETVFPVTIDEVDYQIYSQSVPGDPDSWPNMVKFYLFFLIEADQSYASEDIADISSAFTTMLFWVVIIVLSGFLISLSLIIFTALKTARNITSAIADITRYTQSLKKAPNVDSKKAIIKEISKEPSLLAISEMFEKM